MAGAQRTLISIPGSNHLYMRDAPLFILRSADMTLTTDQTFKPCGAFTSYLIDNIVAKRVSGVFTTACAGGIYTAAGKTGDVLVRATTSYLYLNGANTMVLPTLNTVNADAAGRPTFVYSATPILALTTGNGAALVADFFIWGKVLD